MLGNDINIYENFLAVRSLVLPLEKEYIKYLDLVKICRKLKLYNKGEKLLLRLKKRLKLSNKITENSSMKEIFIKIELSYNKCLFDKGQIQESIDKSKVLIDLLDNSFQESNKNSDNNLIEISKKN